MSNDGPSMAEMGMDPVELGVVEKDVNAEMPSGTEIKKAADDLSQERIIDHPDAVVNLLTTAWMEELHLRGLMANKKIGGASLDLDQGKMEQQVNEVTETDYFNDLKTQAMALRKKKGVQADSKVFITADSIHDARLIIAQAEADEIFDINDTTKHEKIGRAIDVVTRAAADYENRIRKAEMQVTNSSGADSSETDQPRKKLIIELDMGKLKDQVAEVTGEKRMEDQTDEEREEREQFFKELQQRGKSESDQEDEVGTPIGKVKKVNAA